MKNSTLLILAFSLLLCGITSCNKKEPSPVLPAPRPPGFVFWHAPEGTTVHVDIYDNADSFVALGKSIMHGIVTADSDYLVPFKDLQPNKGYYYHYYSEDHRYNNWEYTSWLPEKGMIGRDTSAYSTSEYIVCDKREYTYNVCFDQGNNFRTWRAIDAGYYNKNDSGLLVWHSVASQFPPNRLFFEVEFRKGLTAAIREKDSSENIIETVLKFRSLGNYIDFQNTPPPNNIHDTRMQVYDSYNLPIPSSPTADTVYVYDSRRLLPYAGHFKMIRK